MQFFFGFLAGLISSGIASIVLIAIAGEEKEKAENLARKMDFVASQIAKGDGDGGDGE